MIQTRPIVSWPGPMTPAAARQGRRYKASPNKTRKELVAELEHLKVRSAFIQAAYSDDQIRLDGLPRAGATPAHPGIIVTYELPNGQMFDLPCDSFNRAEQNLRAIVLVLQRLRLINETGVKTQGRQYEGFKRLGNNGENRMPSTPAEAASLIARHSHKPVTADYVLLGPNELGEIYRLAAAKTHPDHGGNAIEFHQVGRAREILIKHFESR